MSRIKRARRWPAVSVAVAALLVALVGTAIAESGPATKSASIKSVSKAVKRALRKSNRAIRIARRAANNVPPGVPGIPGPPGAKGSPGPQGPPGVAGVEIVQVETESNEDDTKEIAAECPSGKRVLGGGTAAEGDFTDVAIDLSAPDGDDGWRGAAHEHDAAEPWHLEVFAICADTD